MASAHEADTVARNLAHNRSHLAGSRDWRPTVPGMLYTSGDGPCLVRGQMAIWDSWFGRQIPWMAGAYQPEACERPRVSHSLGPAVPGV